MALDSIVKGFAKIQKAEIIDEITDRVAGIFSGPQTISGRLDEPDTLPHMSYPIDLHEENGEYDNRIQFTALRYGSHGKSLARSGPKDNELNVKKFSAQTPITEIKSVISLYHPHNLQITYNNEWGTEDLGIAGQVAKENPDYINSIGNGGDGSTKAASSFLGAATGKFQKKIIQFLGDQSGLNLQGAVSKELGIAENPRIGLLFKGVSPRSFNFTFTFAPRTEKEVIQVIAIMKAFRYYSAPSFNNKHGNESFFNYPEVFQIKLFNGTEENTSLFPYGISACTGIEYNYTPQGVWQTFENGFPVLVSLTLNFNELEVITKDIIEREFK